MLLLRSSRRLAGDNGRQAKAIHKAVIIRVSTITQSTVSLPSILLSGPAKPHHQKPLVSNDSILLNPLTRVSSSSPFHTTSRLVFRSSPIPKAQGEEEPIVSDAAEEARRLEKPEGMDAAETEIWNRLVAEYNPTDLVVRDISGGCGSMYFIEVTSDKFEGKKELQQQRMVLATLKGLREGWHGIQLKTYVP